MFVVPNICGAVITSLDSGAEYSTGSVSARMLLDDAFSGQENRLMRANNYLAGVIDLTEGRVWCSYKNVKPHIIRSTIVEKLRKLPDSDLDQRAATLVERELLKQRPCKAK